MPTCYELKIAIGLRKSSTNEEEANPSFISCICTIDFGYKKCMSIAGQKPWYRKTVRKISLHGKTEPFLLFEEGCKVRHDPSYYLEKAV